MSYLICKFLNDQHNQNFAVKPVTHNLLHAFCLLIDILDFLTSKMSLSVIGQMSTFSCCFTYQVNVRITFQMNTYWTEAARLYLILHQSFLEKSVRFHQPDILSAVLKCESGVSRSVQRAVSRAKTNNTCCQWFPPPEAALVLYNDSRPFSTTPATDATRKTIGMDFCR